MTHAKKCKTNYVAFVGFFDEPNDIKILKKTFPSSYYEEWKGEDSHGNDVYQQVDAGFREFLQYEAISGMEGLTVYLALISKTVGHLVSVGDSWTDECFVYLDENFKPIKSAKNYNPNPIEQVEF